MEQGVYLLAGIPIEIRSIYSRVQKKCRDYATDLSPIIHVEISPADISAEYERIASAPLWEQNTAAAACEDYIETLAVYRKIADQAVAHNVILFHGSAIAVDGEAYLFIAQSGVGKSTHTRLWREQFGNRAFMVNDDKPLLRIEDDGVFVCGTPWDGKHRLSRNVIVPLKAVCVLTRGEHNSIVKINREEGFPELLRQCHIPNEAGAVSAALSLLKKLTDFVPLYRLSCNMEKEAALVAYQGMNTGK